MLFTNNNSIKVRLIDMTVGLEEMVFSRHSAHLISKLRSQKATIVMIFYNTVRETMMGVKRKKKAQSNMKESAASMIGAKFA